MLSNSETSWMLYSTSDPDTEGPRPQVVELSSAGELGDGTQFIKTYARETPLKSGNFA